MGIIYHTRQATMLPSLTDQNTKIQLAQTEKNLGARGRVHIRVIEPHKSMGRGPNCRHTDILQGNPTKLVVPN